MTGASLSSGNFTAGKKYRVKVTAHVANSGAGTPSGVQVLRGTTAFADSEAVESRTNAEA